MRPRFSVTHKRIREKIASYMASRYCTGRWIQNNIRGLTFMMLMQLSSADFLDLEVFNGKNRAKNHIYS